MVPTRNITGLKSKNLLMEKRVHRLHKLVNQQKEFLKKDGTSYEWYRDRGKSASV
jgi:hypothetical protein